MTDLVVHSFWWLGMGHYVAEYVKGCDLCNCTKTFSTPLTGKLMPNRVPDHCWQIILVNLIMVVVDCLSKWAYIIPMTSDITVLGVAWLFRDHIWKIHGLPEEVISDRGTQFVSNFMCNLSQILGIKVAASTTYHPQTDSQTKRVNQEVEQFLQLFMNQHQDDWYKWLSIAEFAYNDRVHTSTHPSPFMLDTGQHPRLGIEPLRESCLEAPWPTRRSDQLSSFMHNLSQLLVIKVAASIAYHPQTNGQLEWVNQEVKQFLWLFMNQHQNDWYKWLSIAEFAYNY